MSDTIKVRNDKNLGKVVNVNGTDYHDLGSIKAVKPMMWRGQVQESEFVVTNSSNDKFNVYPPNHRRNEWSVEWERKRAGYRPEVQEFSCSSLVACLKDICNF